LDDIDRIPPKNLITYSLTNTFTSKFKRMTKEKAHRPTDKLDGNTSYEPSTYDYNEFCRFKLEQSYDINKEKEDDPEPFSPIHGELDLTPQKYVYLRADADWSHYDRNFRSHNISATLHDERGDSIFVEHRYQRNSSETIYTDVKLQLSESLLMKGEYERNIFNGIDLKYGLGFLYKAHCWSLASSFTKEGEDLSFRFMITLYGIGQIS